MQKESPKLQEIERLRGIAVLMAVFCHIGAARALVAAPFDLPWAGVDLFFVISGFVVTLSLLRLLPETEGGSLLSRLEAARAALFTFYARRFFRLAPLTLIAVVLAIALAPASERNGVIREAASILAGV